MAQATYTRRAIDWSIPVRYPENMEEKTWAQTALELSDWLIDLFFWSEFVATLKKPEHTVEVVHGSTVKLTFSKHDECADYLVTAFKVLLCCTVILPLIALVVKTVLRAQYTFEYEGRRPPLHSHEPPAASAGSAATAAVGISTAGAPFKIIDALEVGRDAALAMMKRIGSYDFHHFHDEEHIDAIFNPKPGDTSEIKIFLMQVEGEAVGLILVDRDGYSQMPDREMKMWIHVKEGSREKGYGRALLQRAIEYAKSQNKEKLVARLPIMQMYDSFTPFIRRAAPKLGVALAGMSGQFFEINLKPTAAVEETPDVDVPFEIRDALQVGREATVAIMDELTPASERLYTEALLREVFEPEADSAEKSKIFLLQAERGQIGFVVVQQPEIDAMGFNLNEMTLERLAVKMDNEKQKLALLSKAIEHAKERGKGYFSFSTKHIDLSFVESASKKLGLTFKHSTDESYWLWFKKFAATPAAEQTSAAGASLVITARAESKQ
ncbi:MAG: GNAT family N-acetyltransferase [Chlamydiales bacterium]|nr:GNAT family N-acetyltransferase [Chlamydiales bacterium]